MKKYSLNPFKWFLRGFISVVSWAESIFGLPDEWSYNDMFGTDSEMIRKDWEELRQDWPI